MSAKEMSAARGYNKAWEALGYAIPHKAVTDHCRKKGVLKRNTLIAKAKKITGGGYDMRKGRCETVLSFVKAPRLFDANCGGDSGRSLLPHLF